MCKINWKLFAFMSWKNDVDRFLKIFENGSNIFTASACAFSKDFCSIWQQKIRQMIKCSLEKCEKYDFLKKQALLA